MSHPLYIAFIWHMHQPCYRDLVSGECTMPWVRLHGSKDYLDMVSLLADFPNLHQTFNLVPSLIDQLEEYGAPQRRSDHLLELSRKPAAELTDSEKRAILEQCFMANVEQMIKPHGRYDDLFAKRGAVVGEADWPGVLKRFKTQDYLDLQVWFNLVWIDPWLRRQEPVLAQLEAKGSRFTESEKQDLLDRQLGILTRIIPAYREAQARGQVELTTSPYYHPILPLVCDLKNAQVALLRLALPEATFRHPEDARWQTSRAIARHEQVFGRRPAGMWPPEGSVSEDVVRLAIEHGLRWIATDEEILWRTVKTARSPSMLYRPHLLRRKGGSTAIIFRDRELSDLIGFVYSQWEASVAIQDFLKRLEGIHQQFRAEPAPALVGIILDGENAWESYPQDGHPFLRGLYEALSRDERFRLVTVSEFLDLCPVDQQPSLPELFAGSWIDGNFATWIGHSEKNAAWSHLARMRQDLVAARPPTPQAVERPAALDTSSVGSSSATDTPSPERTLPARSPAERVPARSQATELGDAEQRNPERAARGESEARGGSPDQAWRSFYAAQGSDWMWWFGDTHSSAQDEEFDRLFRMHLANVYRGLGQEVPEWLAAPIRAKTIGPLYEPTASMTPTIDGRDTTYYEWLYAGRVDLHKGYAAIHRGRQALQMLQYGFDQAHGFFRLDVDRQLLAQRESWRIILEFPHERTQITVEANQSSKIRAVLKNASSSQGLRCAYDRLIELALPKLLLGLKAGGMLHLRLALVCGAQTLERYPAHGTFQIPIPKDDFEASVWSV